MGGHKNTPAKDNFCDTYNPSLLTGDVSQASQDSFCVNEYCDFLQILLLIFILNKIGPVFNVKNLMLRQAILLYRSILENCLYHSGDRKYPIKLILILDTGYSDGLTLFLESISLIIWCATYW